MACISEDDLLAFAAGQLTEPERVNADLHIDECELCQELLNEAVHALTPSVAASRQEPAPWSTMFRPGMVVGERYEIRRFVARGGMGEVYEAFDRELQERVALKTVTSTAADNPSAVRRLKAEVQLARRVSHPSVCRIYDFGTHAPATGGAQTCFLTMEFVDGQTLGERLRQGGALEVSEATALARALLHGLQAAHDAGVLHRDFKSDNVILRTDALGTSPRILDFGLARACDQPPQQSSSSHGFVGTFAYVAPEQLEGNPYTTASDIYSFGIVWFEMLTGELPFKARSTPAMTTLERLTKPVAPPSRHNPRIPPDLDAIVLGCLTRPNAQRFQSAREVLERLDELEREGPRPRKRRWLPLGVAAVAGGLLAALAVQAALDAARPTAAVSSSPPVPTLPPTAAAPLELPLAPATASAAQAPQAPPLTGPRKQVGAAVAKAPSAKPSALASAPEPAPSTPAPAAAAIRLPGATTHGWENPFAE